MARNFQAGEEVDDLKGCLDWWQWMMYKYKTGFGPERVLLSKPWNIWVCHAEFPSLEAFQYVIDKKEYFQYL